MSVPLIEIKDASLIALPWIAFLIGLGGSLHCVSMCGGLVTACAKTKREVAVYQVGRLMGYLLIGLFASVLGHLLIGQFQK